MFSVHSNHLNLCGQDRILNVYCVSRNWRQMWVSKIFDIQSIYTGGFLSSI